MRVAVVGAGVAGTAAAWAAKRAGAGVVVLHDRGGASALGSGAVDREPWEKGAAVQQLGAEETELCRALGVVAGREACLLATSSGVLRPARARDAALLDLSGLGGKRIAVADVPRDDWDAELLARSLGDSAWAKTTRTRFAPRAIELGAESFRRVPSWDFAARFDEEAEWMKLGTELGKARGEVDAWLLGPWLGVRPGVAEALRRKALLPLGEVLSLPGGAAGARFEAARDALFTELGVEVRRAKVESVVRGKAGYELALSSGESAAADRVVLAIGGVLGSGVVLDAARPAHPGGACFHPSLEAPVQMEVNGQPVDSVSTLYGVDFAAHGVELVERVGIAVSGALARGADGIFVAGDAIADRPRTWLRALSSGIVAGRAALG